MPNEHYWFCQKHAAEYNKNWNFFAGMNEAQIRNEQETEKVTGGRPTWSFKADAARARPPPWPPATPATSPTRSACSAPSSARPRRPRRRRSPPGQAGTQALADLDLDGRRRRGGDRAKYKDLLKRCHPDMNGGDRSAEHKLQRVIKAYKTLQKAGLTT
jgi:hypothetical protein